uniref:Uncharacterized protein n=1 Tax=Anguilla anguilla TaxID=7936 RepID=A0A0E9S5F8_ANGAN
MSATQITLHNGVCSAYHYAFCNTTLITIIIIHSFIIDNKNE